MSENITCIQPRLLTPLDRRRVNCGSRAVVREQFHVSEHLQCPAMRKQPLSRHAAPSVEAPATETTLHPPPIRKQPANRTGWWRERYAEVRADSPYMDIPTTAFTLLWRMPRQRPGQSDVGVRGPRNSGRAQSSADQSQNLLLCRPRGYSTPVALALWSE
jgi:hypothetical protein